MARAFEKLSDLKVRKVKSPGYLGDGGGLYLQVSPSLSKSWVFRYQVNGRTREMGLGSLNTFGLRDARDRATSCRKLLADGIDPIEQRNAAQQEKRLSICQKQRQQHHHTTRFGAHMTIACPRCSTAPVVSGRRA